MHFLKSAPLALCLSASALLWAAPASAQTTKPSTAPATASAEELAKQADGQLAAEAWLTQLDQRNWGGAYEAASQSFRNMVKIDQWMDSIPGVRAPLGNYQSRSVDTVAYKTTLAGRPAGEYVTAIFNTVFSKKNDAQEVVTTARDADGKWRVIGYQPR